MSGYTIDESDLDMKKGERIQAVMDYAQRNQARFAEELGVSHTSPANWLKGKGPGTNRLRQIATTYGVSFEWLSTGRGTMIPETDVFISSDYEPKALVQAAEEAKENAIRLSELHLKGMRAGTVTQRRLIQTLEDFFNTATTSSSQPAELPEPRRSGD